MFEKITPCLLAINSQPSRESKFTSEEMAEIPLSVNQLARPIFNGSAEEDNNSCVQFFRMSNGQKVKFTYSVKRKTIKASFEGPGGFYETIPPWNLPRELRGVHNTDWFQNFFIEVCVRIARLSNGEAKLYLSGKLPGGDPYKIALEELRNHLKDLANPVLVKELLDALLTLLKSEKIDVTDIFGDLFKLTLPDETVKLLKTLSAQVVTRAKEENLDPLVEEIKNDLLELTREKRNEEYPLWETLKLFLELREIRVFKNEFIKQILNLIKNEDTNELSNYVIQCLEANQIEESEMDAQLEKTEYSDFQTLLGEIIVQKPKEKEGLDVYWDKIPEFFIKKTLYLNDPDTLESYGGIILNCMSALLDGNRGFHFDFQNQSIRIVKIGFRYDVVVNQKSSYKLWMALKEKEILNDEEPFEVICMNERLISKAIPPGFYKIIQRAYKKPMIGMIGTPYTEIKLENCQSSEEQYILYVYEKKDGRGEIRIEKWSAFEGEYKKLAVVEISVFNGAYTAVKTVKKPIDKINGGNIETCTRIKDEKDPNAVKRLYLKEIEILMENLRTQLLNKQQLLNRLMDNLIVHEFKEIEMKVLSRHKNLFDLVKAISQKYAEIEIIRKPESVLKEIVEEANYSRFTNTGKGVMMRRTLTFLKNACSHAENLNMKDVIFYMGYTGAGKSTAVSCCLGARMKVEPNSVGDLAAIIKEGQERFPKIGQSLGISETLYTQGYPVKDDENTLLADCPGFEDTRGGDSAFCTNFSMDQAIEKAGQIKSIVVVAPLETFTSEKGNGVVRLVSSIRERFPFAFNPKKKSENAHLYLLITKHEKKKEAVKKFNDGTRMAELCKETEKRIEELLQEKKEGGLIDFELKAARHRNKIWQAIRQMQNNGKMDFIPIGNTIAGKRLLGKYRGIQGGLEKKHYQLAMQDKEMQEQFGKCVQMSTHTWKRLILKYFREIPEDFLYLKSEIRKHEDRLDQAVLVINAEEIRLKKFQQHQNQLTELIGKLKKAQGNPNDYKKILELQKGVAKTTNKTLSMKKKWAERRRKEIQDVKKDLKKVEEEIKQLIKSVEARKKIIKSMKSEVNELSKGDRAEILWELRYKPDQIVKWGNEKKSGAYEAAYKKMHKLKEEDYEEIHEIKASAMRGTLRTLVLIEKKYKIVDSNFKDIFKYFGISTSESQPVQAMVEGERYKCDLVEKTDSSGKKMAYSFETEWKGDVIPWIRISCNIPNRIFNEAAIDNLKADIRELRERQRITRWALDKDLDGEKEMRIGFPVSIRRRVTKEEDLKPPGARKRKVDLEIKLKKLESTLPRMEMEIKELEEVVAGEIETMLKVQQNSLENETRAINGLIESLQEKVKEKSDIEEEIKRAEKNMERHLQKKRHLASIIQTQIETAALLRNFSKLIVGSSREKEKEKEKIYFSRLLEDHPEMGAACREFNEAYDMYIEEVKNRLDYLWGKEKEKN